MTPKEKPWRVNVSKPKRLFDDFFKIDEVHVSYEQFDGEMSPEKRLLIFERGDAVAALLHDPARRKIIAVNQFRIPTREKGQDRGWLVEAVAGMIKTDNDGKQLETPDQCLIREVMEETGYNLTHFNKIAKFFSSPGGSTEIIHLYYASVRQAAKEGAGGGVKADGEDIQLIEYDIDDFFQRLNAGEFEDPKLIIAGQWLASRRSATPAEGDETVSQTFKFRVKEHPDQILGIKTGNIKAVKGIDVWVNSENTDMMMDRFFGRSVSATIRGLGAKKDGKGNIVEDTIGKALTAQLDSRQYVRHGTVLKTISGELEQSHKVRAIYHVATVSGGIGEGLSTSVEVLKQAIDNVLEAISSSKQRYRSALIPIFGTGHGGIRTDLVAPMLVERTIDFFKANPGTKLQEIYFLAYSQGDLDLLREKMKLSPSLVEVK